MTTPDRPAILGFTQTSPEATKLANHFKLLEEAVLRVLDATQGTDLDPRWVAVARTHMNEGFMALNRANFKPQRIEGAIALDDVLGGALEILAGRRAATELKPGMRRYGDGGVA